MLRPDRDHHAYDIYDAVLKLAREGYGHEDIVAKMSARLAPKHRDWVRRVVMSTRAEYRGWLK